VTVRVPGVVAPDGEGEFMTGDPVSGQPLARGEKIGPFVVVELLGRGGMGHVYLACSASGRPFAVKTIIPDFVEDPDYRRRFAREAELAARVKGVYTAEVVDADPDAPVPWMATAYVPAPSLGELVHACGVLPEPAVRWLAAGVAEGLRAVHAADLIHRDVKPSNVLVTLDGPRLIDFGIAEALDRTRTLTTLGTVAYIAPEQARAEPLTAAADVYSLGSTMVYAASGYPPHHGDNLLTVLNSVAHRAPDLSLLPPGLMNLVERCLRPAPADRPLPDDVIAMFDPFPHVLDGELGALPWLPPEHLRLIREFGSAGARARRSPGTAPTRRYGDATAVRYGAVPPPPEPFDLPDLPEPFDPFDLFDPPGPSGPPPDPGDGPVPSVPPRPAAPPEPPGPPEPRRSPDPPGPFGEPPLGRPPCDGPAAPRRNGVPPAPRGSSVPGPDRPAAGSGPEAGSGAPAPATRRLPDDLHRRRLRAERDAAGERHDEALREYAAIVDECVRRYGPRDRLSLAVRHDHAFWLGGLGRPELALQRYTSLVRDHLDLLGPDDPGTLAVRHNHACCVGMAGDAEEAARLLGRVAADRERVLGADHRATFTAYRSLAHWTGHAGRPGTAADVLRRLVPEQERALGPEHPDTAAAHRARAYWEARAALEGDGR
jgi:serine/threonine protein kinase